MSAETSPTFASTPPASVSLLATLSPEAPFGAGTFQFTTVTRFFRVADKHGDFLVFSNVTSDDLLRIEAGREKRQHKFRFHFRPVDCRLEVTIPSFPHETICHALERAVILDIAKMGIQTTDYVFSGATKYQGQGGGGGGGSGEGDTTLVPTDRVLTEDKWPTFAVECGLSQSLHSLRNTMRWWFLASQHEVKIVLLIKLYRDTRQVCLEKYIKDTSQTRPGATQTRSTAQVQPRLVQTITMAPQAQMDGERPRYQCIGGPLVLEFRLLFLREPDADASERDVTISSQDLERAAQALW